MPRLSEQRTLCGVVSEDEPPIGETPDMIGDVEDNSTGELLPA